MSEKIYSHENFVQNFNHITENFINDLEELKRLYKNYDNDRNTYHRVYNAVKDLVKANIDNKPCKTAVGVAKIDDKEIKARFILATYLAGDKP